MQTDCLFQIRFVTNMVCFLPLPVLFMVEGIYSGENGINFCWGFSQQENATLILFYDYGKM